MLKVLIGADGSPQEVTVEKSSGSRDLDQAAIAAVKTWMFNPGQKGGRPRRRVHADWFPSNSILTRRKQRVAPCNKIRPSPPQRPQPRVVPAAPVRWQQCRCPAADGLRSPDPQLRLLWAGSSSWSSCVMSVMSWYFIVVNFLRNAMMRSRMEKVHPHVLGNAVRAGRDPLHGRAAQGRAVLEDRARLRLGRGAPPAPRRQPPGRGAEPLGVHRPRAAPGRGPRKRPSRRRPDLLATVGSTAPFVGLLGTVWGIYHALIRIGASGNASIEAVAGPVGEALIMTALGLFVAIPAVLALQLLRAREPRHLRPVRRVRARPARLLRHRFARRASVSAESRPLLRSRK